VADEQVVKLLEEIRDLQKLHVENYKDALKNQQEAIYLQKNAMRRQRIFLVVLIVFLAAIVAVSIWSSHP
jgi:ABC-type lipoprotein release transport system permease subunit